MPPALWVGCFRFHGLLTAPDDVVLHRGVVWDAARAARARGVHPGQDAAAVRVAWPEARCRPFDPAADAPRLTAAWDLLAAAAAAVEPDPDGRPEAYAAWPGGPPPAAELRALADAVARTLPHVDLAVGLAGNRLLARVARPAAAGCRRVAPAAAAGWLSRQPLALLVAEGLLPPSLHRRLAQLGLVRCGQVASLPEAALAERFGPAGRRLHALCRGEDGRPVQALYPPRVLAARRGFPEGLPHACWPQAAAALTRAAAAGLRAGEGVGRLELDLGRPLARVWRHPCADAAALARAAAELARRAAAAGAGPAEHLEVRLCDLAVLPARPLSLLERSRDATRVDELLDRLPQRLLRRGWGRLDRHEALLALLDPWRATTP